MTPENVELIKETIKKTNKKNLKYYLLAIITGLIISLASEWAMTKGRDYATKQDVSAITDSIESIKSKISLNQSIELQKSELKYNALLQSLKLIDCYISMHWESYGDTIIDKQYATTEDYRNCQNQLILTCSNSELITKFYQLIFPKPNIKMGQEMTFLNEYRQMVRTELQFGENLKLDSNKIWIAHTITNPK